MRLRIQFEKRGAMRFCSHKDIVRMFQRCFAAGKLPVAFSEGFHPHMRMSFGPPAKTGWESLEEYMDIHVLSGVDHLQDTCNKLLPNGLRVRGSARLADGVAKLANDIAATRLGVSISIDALECAWGEKVNARNCAQLRDRIAERFGPNEAAQQEHEPVILDVQTVIEEAELVLEYVSTMHGGRVVTPDQVVAETIGDPAELSTPIRVARVAQYVRRGDALVSPIDEGVVRNTS